MTKINIRNLLEEDKYPHIILHLLYCLILLILFSPTVLKFVKLIPIAGLIVLSAVIVIRKKYIPLHTKVKTWVLIYILSNFFYLIRGTYNNIDVFYQLAPVNIVWPILYMLALIIPIGLIKKVQFSNTFIMSTLLIELYILYIYLNFTGYLPDSPLSNLQLGQVINYNFGYINFFTPSITSLFFLLPYIFALLFVEKKPRKTVFLLVLIIIGALISLLIGRRALIAIFVISPFIAIFWLKLSRKSQKNSNFTKIISLICLIFIVAIVFVNVVDVGLRIQNLNTDLIKNGTNIRLNQYNSLIEGWKKAPFLGVGFGVNAEVIRSESVPGTYELSYIARLYQTGISGIVIYFFLILWIIWKLIYFAKENGSRIIVIIPLLTGLGSVLLAEMTNPYISSFDGLFILFYPLALINNYYLYGNKKEVELNNNVTIQNQSQKVIIFMATYNGENYITEQLNSIVNQSYTNWDLIIRDDRSKDGTMDILEFYEKKDTRIKILHDEYGNVGQCKNFDLLMHYGINEEAYFMFADQDDVWNKTKVEFSVNKINSIVESSDRDIPILVFSNYEISNSILSDKKLAYNKSMVYPQNELVSRLLIQNWIMGCTTIINKSLLQLSCNIPSIAENHDNWMAVLCSLTGKIGYIEEPTMIHRIHLNNVTTKTSTTNLKFRLVRVVKRFKDNEKNFEMRYIFYIAIKDRIYDKIDKERKEILDSYSKILKSGKINAIIISFKNKFFGFSKLQTTLFYLQLLTKKKYK